MKRPPRKKVPPPEPVVFEHAPVENKYDRVAKRVMAAVSELNDALEEAHAMAEMRVFLGSLRPDGHAMRFEPAIYRLSHATMTMMVKIKEEPEKAWQLVKNNNFADVAGTSLASRRKST